MDNTALPSGLSQFGVKSHDIFDDFLWGTLESSGPTSLSSVILNSGVATYETSAPTDNTYTGKLNISTGTVNSNTGKAAYQSSGGTNRIKAGGGTVTLEWRIRITTLSGTPSFNTKIGLQDNSAVGTPANGIYFYYSDTDSGKFTCVTRNASTSTIITTTGVTVAAATWYKLRIQINSTGNNVDFFINDVWVANSTTNIPTTNAMMLMASIEKQGTASATARTMDIDWLYFRVER